jgi:ribosomal protein S18 acetylase RimI-like enzyme
MQYTQESSHDRRRDGPELEIPDVEVRTMSEGDIERVVSIDAESSGQRRPDYFALQLRRSREKHSLHISLVAEVDGIVVGFVVGTVYYGEFGLLETSATIDAIGVQRRLRGRSVGRALMRQLRLNLGSLRVTAVRTEVAWDDFELLGFLRREGFKPSNRLCLETILDPTAPETEGGE